MDSLDDVITSLGRSLDDLAEMLDPGVVLGVEEEAIFDSNLDYIKNNYEQMERIAIRG